MTREEKTCCGVIEEARMQAREKNERRTRPQPWIVRKMTIGITLGLIAYSSYVYIGRFAVSMIIRDREALGGQPMGIAFLIIFCLLLLMLLWTYTMVVITPPGYAKDLVEKSERPGVSDPPARPSWNSNDLQGTAYELTSPTVDLSRLASREPVRARSTLDSRIQRDQPSPTSGNDDSLVSPATSTVAKPDRYSQGTNHIPEEPHVLNALTPIVAQVPSTSAVPPSESCSTANEGLPPRMLSRRPPSTPVLLSEYRYCSKDELIKPFRAHHCRACGTCVLKYDHHCPWIGHCVGAYNHRFFVIFLIWAVLFTCWTFSTLLGLNVRPYSRMLVHDIDPQHIVVIALTGFFGIFAVLMLISQIMLIRLNQTTVESIGFRLMREREAGTLAYMYSWYDFGARRRTLKKWDQEWGQIGTEGNLWWLGSSDANWEAVMGKNMWWWFLPIGHRLDDGLSYPTNPRFDSQGRWRRRKEWPSDLR
ncbi:hypothetical protein SERLA73DRAFT_187681 [Serpula lacrymans var. lacrymans S7.3]|uniref:Palmitoyltransferase n=2 Tax=Serpula lacrymans var. lacrymans TaxID=341189 RepID=F8QA54_SERL3|nr:uncharacterized protein SERLADRAFT_477437 [Serpula lacrymans var. lacrymans S7.9]EGN94644.1 hypothetical protein SERLA73DRAFT_187681 [Serpula lacrymans var. lacrymans S7.3]EGO20124.1 hypothetical protein SERLADRAFT_477437 [Serpula lacrymans var. lacrymans S7.9]